MEFYKDLFKSNCDTGEKALNDILGKIDRRLDENSNDHFENDITSTEILDALKT